jgi:hypothetical protein
VDRAKKAGLGDIGMVIECASFQGGMMMMDEEAGQGDVASRVNPRGECGVSDSLGKRKEKEAEGSAHGRPRRDTIMPLGSMVRSGDMDCESGDGGGGDDDDEDDMELSDCEWEGWMRDFDRQGHVERESSLKAQSSAKGGGGGTQVVGPPPSSAPSDIEYYEIAQSRTAVEQRPQQRKSILRHVCSASNLRRHVRGDNADAPCPMIGAEDHPAGGRERKTTGLVKGVSAQAE